MTCAGVRCRRVATTSCGTIARHRADRAAKRMVDDGDPFGDAVGHWGLDVTCASSLASKALVTT